MNAQGTFWTRWILHFSFGELIGITITSIVARLLIIGLSRTALSGNASMAYTILIIAALTEGLIIGYVQWKSLSVLIPRLTEQSWLITTAVTTVAAWLVILVPVVVIIPILAGFNLMSVFHLSLMIMVAGAAFGAIIGTSQYFILKKFYRNAITWALASALGWSISFITIFTAWSAYSDKFHWIVNTLFIIVSCIVSGMVQGIVTGICLHTMMSRRINSI